MFTSKSAAVYAGAFILLVTAALGYRDYKNWLALGPGGLPYNVGGWFTTLWRELQGHDPLDVERYANHIGVANDSSYLDGIGIREGTRPHVGHWPIPQRQLDQLANSEMKKKAFELFEAKIVASPELLGKRLSVFEKRNEALALLKPEIGGPAAKKTAGEIGHIHPTDGSMHMTLSPRDAKKVIENGWGQAHLLAGRGALPDTYIFIYPPRNEQELIVTTRILDAAIDHISGNQ